MTTSTRRTVPATALLAAAVLLLTSCGTNQAPSATGVAAPAGDVFASAESVTAAFATAYAGGDTPTACTFTSGPALEKLTSKGLCTTRANWSQTPRLTKQCTDPDGEVHFAYDVDSEVDRNLQFKVYAGRDTSDRWTVTRVISEQSGSRIPLCSQSAGSSTSASAG